jgi:quinol monooxygenase YgiN
MHHSPTIAVIGFMRFAPERITDILPYVRSLVVATKLEAGCIDYQVGIDVLDPGVLRVSELWTSSEALEKHTQAPHIAPWHAAQRNCGILEREYKVIEIADIRTT